MALSSSLPIEDSDDLDFELFNCAGCESTHLMGEVCGQCGLCQVCGELAEDCTCEVHAYDRYMEADYQDWLDARYS